MSLSSYTPNTPGGRTGGPTDGDIGAQVHTNTTLSIEVIERAAMSDMILPDTCENKLFQRQSDATSG